MDNDRFRKNKIRPEANQRELPLGKSSVFPGWELQSDGWGNSAKDAKSSFANELTLLFSQMVWTNAVEKRYTYEFPSGNFPNTPFLATESLWLS
jgi:hypothetical protein